MNNENRSDKDLTITIKTTLGDWVNTFDKTSKVEDVIKAVINHFNYAQNGKYELRPDNDPNTVMLPSRPLVSYGIKDGDALIYTDLGIAV